MRHGWSNPVCHFGTKRAESPKSGLIWVPSQRVGSIALTKSASHAAFVGQTSGVPVSASSGGVAGEQVQAQAFWDWESEAPLPCNLRYRGGLVMHFAGGIKVLRNRGF